MALSLNKVTPTVSPAATSAARAAQTSTANNSPVSGSTSNGLAKVNTVSPAPVSSASPLSSSQQSAQSWINNAASGQGGINAYIGKQNDRYNTALAQNDTDLINRLNADSQRVGYSLNSNNQGQGDIFTPGSFGGYDPTAQEKAYMDMQLASLYGQQNNLQNNALFGINQNKQYLQEQLASLGKQEAVSNDSAQQLQNRRGGFYSGGLDYQLGGIAQQYGQARNDLSRDIASRNQNLINQYGNDANTIAQQIQTLQFSQPDILRQRIQNYVDSERGYGLDYANTFGGLNGQQTQSMQGQQFDQNRSTKNDNWNAYGDMVNWTQNLGQGPQDRWQNLTTNAGTGQNTFAGDQAIFNNNMSMADLTGFLPDGTQTTAEQQRQLGNLWTLAQETGRIPDELADFYGVPRGTSTLDAQNLALSRQREARISSGRSSGGSSGSSGTSVAKEYTGGVISDPNLPRTASTMETWLINNLPGGKNIQGPVAEDPRSWYEEMILSNPNLSEKDMIKLYNRFGIPLPE